MAKLEVPPGLPVIRCKLITLLSLEFLLYCHKCKPTGMVSLGK